MTDSGRVYRTAMLAVLAFDAALLVVVALMPRDYREPFLTEDGPVEMLSAVLLFIAAGILAVSAPSGERGRFLPEFIVVLTLGLRELDFDDRFFTNGLMKPNQYVGSEVGIVEKLYSAVILIAILWATFVVARRYLPGFVRRLKAHNPADQAIALAFGIAILSELLDTPSRKLEVFGIDTSPAVNEWAMWIEETLELAFPLLLIVAIRAGFAQYRRHSI